MITGKMQDKESTISSNRPSVTSFMTVLSHLCAIFPPLPAHQQWSYSIFTHISPNHNINCNFGIIRVNR